MAKISSTLATSTHPLASPKSCGWSKDRRIWSSIKRMFVLARQTICNGRRCMGYLILWSRKQASSRRMPKKVLINTENLKRSTLGSPWQSSHIIHLQNSFVIWMWETSKRVWLGWVMYRRSIKWNISSIDLLFTVQKVPTLFLAEPRLVQRKVTKCHGKRIQADLEACKGIIDQHKSIRKALKVIYCWVLFSSKLLNTWLCITIFVWYFTS